MDATPVVDLHARKAQSTAQGGENGILAAIFETIGTTNKVCVDCGAFDLEKLSNVCPLWRDQGWTAILIEGNPWRALGMARRFRAMKAAGHASGHVTVVHRYAQAEGPDSLDAILAGKSAPSSFDLITIDVDGIDYEVWEGLRDHRPRVVVIEYNATIPAHISLVGGPGNYVGSSARALLELGRSKGYDLVAATTTNLIFVDSALAASFAGRNDLSALFGDSRVTYAFQTYDGAIVLAGAELQFGYNPFSRYTRQIARCSLQLRRLPSTGEQLARIWGRGVILRSAREPVRLAFRAASPVIGRWLKAIS